jgi:hypothetical protein
MNQMFCREMLAVNNPVPWLSRKRTQHRIEMAVNTFYICKILDIFEIRVKKGGGG